MLRPFVALAVVALAVPLRADGLLQTWPDDGAWARYNCTFEKADVDVEQKDQLDGTLTMSMVGTVMIEGKKHRWLELEFHFKAPDGKKHVFVQKVLLPEGWRDKKNKKPHRPVRMWTKFDDKPVVQAMRKSPKWARVLRDILNPALDDPAGERQGEIQETASKPVKYQKGTLEGSRGLKERFSRKSKGPDGRPLEWKSTRTFQMHERVPFGVAELKVVERELHDGDLDETETAGYYIESFGTGAKSTLPNKK